MSLELGAFASALMDGSISVIDLTHTLQAMTTPPIVPPDHGAAEPPARGGGWAWNDISMGDQAGTHLDAPSQDGTGGISTIPVQRFLAPAVVIDCASEAAADPCFLLRPEHIEAWEATHGRIPAGTWVLMRTDWGKRADPGAFLNVHPDGAHTPGPTPEAMRLLVEERDVIGWGVETVDLDHGQASGFHPPFPAKSMIYDAGKLGLAGLCNLDRLPPFGAVLITAPLKIEKGAASPLRVLALVSGEATRT